MTPPCIVLVNPRAAGGRGAAMLQPIGQWLARHAADTPCEVADGAEAARRAVARQPSGTRVVLVGGDGTVHHALPALLERQCTLALVPVGSGNDIARALGLRGLSWQEALALALRSQPSAIDLGRCDGAGRVTYFASSLTAGFDSAVGERALNGPGRLRGLPRYLLATVRELAALRTWPMTIKHGDAVLHHGPALFASVLNTPTYGGGMPAVPQACIDDGRLDLLVAGRFTRLGAALMLPRLLAARHLSHPRVSTLPFSQLDFEGEVAVPLAGDGELAGAARAWKVTVLPGALKAVRAPA